MLWCKWGPRRTIRKALLLLVGLMLLYSVTKRSPRLYMDRLAAFREIVGIDLMDKFHDYNTCIYARTFSASPSELLEQLVPIMDQCKRDLQLTDASIDAFRGESEFKYHILPNEGSEGRGCTIVTVGIGSDVRSEMGIRKRLRDVQWRCAFHGADSMAHKNKELYEAVGSFYNVGVTNQTNLERRGNKKGSKGRNTVEVELVQFLRNSVRASYVVDQLLLTADYDMIPYFHEGSPLDEEGIEICQVNVVFKGAIDTTAFARFMRKALREHRWIFFKPLIGRDVRLFMLNIESPSCAERYIVDKF
uniref:Methyltransf_21 domain-containing protein n=1 Tax=Steinernema glaseri TaxID=37863 RepID=A0A1I7Z5M6_9BILA